MKKHNKPVIQGQHLTDEQWGNIQLPGVTDEQLHNRKFHRSLMLKQLAKDPVWREKNEKNHADPVWREKISNTMKLRCAEKTPEAEQRRIAGIKRVTQTAEWKANNLIAAKRKAQDPAWLAATTAASRRKAQDPAWLAACQAAQELRKTDYQTPYGVVRGVQACTDLGFDIQEKIKSLPHLYYRLSEGPGAELTEKVYYSPWMTSNSIKKIYQRGQELMLHKRTHKDITCWYKHQCKNFPNCFYTKIEVKREWDLKK